MVAQKKQPLQSSEGQVHPTASRLLPSQPTVHTFPLSIDPKVLLSFHFGHDFPVKLWPINLRVFPLAKLVK
jgi:hypothetical protein